MNVNRSRLFITAVGWLLIAHTSVVWSGSIDAFVGEYQGSAKVESGGNSQTRDLDVEILNTDKGFTVRWKTVISKASGEISSREYTVNFEPSERTGIYASAMKPGLFGGSKPLDPMKGDPYVWARVEGSTLTIYAMLITDSGEYEMQVYERTLADDGLKLDFTRYRRAQVLSHVKATLLRK